MKTYLSIIMIAMMLPAVFAQEALNAGMTPDSPFYFADKLFDVFQSVESRADERAGEALAMAQKGHEKGLEKALLGYEKAMQKRQENAQGDAIIAEKVARQSAAHIEALAKAQESVPEQSKQGLARALGQSAKVFESSLNELKKKDPEKAGTVAAETLMRVMERAPDAALKGLQNALDNVQKEHNVSQEKLDAAKKKSAMPSGAAQEESLIESQSVERSVPDQVVDSSQRTKSSPGKESASNAEVLE